MFRTTKQTNYSFCVKSNLSIRRLSYLSIPYLFLFFSLTLTNCQEAGKLDQKDAIGLLGLPANNQTPTNSEEGSEKGVLPPIPPVVGLPAAPGQPLNAPILNQPQTLTENAPVAEDPYGFLGNILIDQISFQLPVHNQTTITAYIGGRNMALEQDGTVVNATNFRTLTPTNPNGGAFGFNFRIPADKKQKLFLVARNEFGASSKEINFSHIRNCMGAPIAPITIGNCDQHCFEITNIAGQMEFKSKLKHGELTYLEFDFYGVSPKTGAHLLIPNSFSYIWDDPAKPFLQPGVTTVATVLNQDSKDSVCVELQSSIVLEDDNGNLNFDFIHSKIRME
ncbi:hypothetical protein CH359_10265 [Leptospira meyeri]|nr:hypothetical protein CH359_10265 [Leptospira meyeri]PJZ96253.1 hypothetical protein CH358_11935 [Leptospira meyeri]